MKHSYQLLETGCLFQQHFNGYVSYRERNPLYFVLWNRLERAGKPWIDTFLRNSLEIASIYELRIVC